MTPRDRTRLEGMVEPLQDCQEAIVRLDRPVPYGQTHDVTVLKTTYGGVPCNWHEGTVIQATNTTGWTIDNNKYAKARIVEGCWRLTPL